MIVKNVEKKESSSVTFQVEVDADAFEKAVNGSYLKSRKNIMVPGFRKGKAPRMLLEGMYGSDFFYDDAVNELAGTAFAQAVEQESLRPVGKPSVTDFEVKEDKSLVMTFETAVYPEVTLGAYKGLEAVRPDADAAEADIEAELLAARRSNSRLLVVERPAAMGDTVNIDYAGTIDGDPFEGGTAEHFNLVLGSGNFVPGFEGQLVGVLAGDEKNVDILFDDDYAAPVAGKRAVFHVKVNEVKTEELPEADDEFAKDVSEFDTIAEYKESIAKSIREKKETAAKNSFEDALVDLAVSNMTADIPPAMIEERMDMIFKEYAQYMGSQGMALEEYLSAIGSDFATFRESSRSTAEKQVKTELLLAAVAEAEAIELTDEDFEAEYAQIAARYNLEIEKVKAAIEAESLKPDLLGKKAMAIIAAAGVALPPPAETPAETVE